jgi:hypothetical protein
VDTTLVSSTPSCPVTNCIEFVNAVVTSPQNALCFPVATQNLFKVEAQCTPSRSALMTGRSSIRSGTYEVPIGGVADALTLWKSPSRSYSQETTWIFNGNAKLEDWP